MHYKNFRLVCQFNIDHKMWGVAHLAGDNSVVDLLRKRGYKVVKLQK